MKTSAQSSRARGVHVGALVLVVPLTLLLAGCSGGGGGSGGSGASAAAGASSAPSADAGSGAGGSAAASGGEASAAAGGGTGGGATGGAVTDPGHLADLLGPGDFAAVGVSGAGTPTVNPGDPGSVAVVYAGKSAGTGGIEMDAVVGDTAEGMDAVFASMSAPFLDFEGAGKAALPEADDALLRTDNPLDNGGEWAGIAVQEGRLVFLIGIPSSDAAAAQLVALAKLVLERGKALE